MTNRRITERSHRRGAALTMLERPRNAFAALVVRKTEHGVGTASIFGLHLAIIFHVAYDGVHCFLQCASHRAKAVDIVVEVAVLTVRVTTAEYRIVLAVHHWFALVAKTNPTPE